VSELDSDIIERAKRGDEEALNTLFERHAPALHRLAVALLGNTADAEDAMQETFLGAFQNIGSFAGRASIKTWLSRILLNQAARLRRAKRVREAVRAVDFNAPATIALKGNEIADGSGDSGIRMDVLAALDGLSAEFKAVVVLREFEGLSYGEIADVLDVPQGTVESRLFRARRELQEKLKGYIERK
jgi:RNA polymerase sigma-70 factor (ECF subfamily)